MAPLAPSELNELFSAPLDLGDVYSEAINAWDNCASSDPIERTIAFYIRLYLQDDILVKVDRASMLHSLEVRAPFLDCDLVEFLRRLPTNMKLRNGTSKWILRQCAQQLLPREVLTRSKQGFAVPMGQWLRDGRMPAAQAAINHEFWKKAMAMHHARRSDQRLALWANWIFGALPPGELAARATAIRG
jgi:asparagine synthase (glutamine-hydrolysing)